MKGLPEAWSKDATATNMSRPNSLFGHGAPESQDLKDLYLQDLSDGKMSQNSTKLKTRLKILFRTMTSQIILVSGICWRRRTQIYKSASK